MSALRHAVLERGLVAADDLEALEKWASYKSAGLAERLYRSGVVSDAQLCEVFVSLGATDATADLVARRPPPAALGALTRPVAERHRAVPLRVERSRLVVAMLDPSDTDAIEKLSFFCGLAVEPRAARPRALFQALSESYSVPMVTPDGGFLARHSLEGRASGAPGGAAGFTDPPNSGEDDDCLPAPSPDIPRRIFGAPENLADPHESPLARAVHTASGEGDPVYEEEEQPTTLLALRRPRAPDTVKDATHPALDDAPTVTDTSPAHAPAALVDDAALEAIRRALPPGSALEARDSLPPQVLRLLVPPLRCAVLFLVRGNVAVGWDGRTPSLGRDSIRDVLLPLTAPSAFGRAVSNRRVALGDAADPSTIERILWRHLGEEPPTSFAVMPLLVGSRPEALLYVDRSVGRLNDALIDVVRRVGTTLADGLAPFVAAGTLFPPVRPDKLAPIPS